MVQRKETHCRVPQRPALVTGGRLLWQQFSALNKKNLLIRARAWKTNLLLVAQAVLFVLLTRGVDCGVTASRQRQPAFSSVPHAVPAAVGSIPDCATSLYLRQGEPCYTVLYAPEGVEAVDAVMQAVAANNAPPIPAAHVRGFQDAREIDEYLAAHPETVLGSVVFSADPQRPTSLGFTVQTNSSVQWFKGKYQDPNTYMQIPLQSAVERELVRLLTGRPELGWEVEMAQYPHPAAQSPSMIGQFAPTFLFASIMFQFVLLVHDVVCERESGARRAMATMGLLPLPFWASWVLFQSVLAVVEACLLTGFSYALGFELFVENDVQLSFLLLLLVSLSMTAFGFFVAAFLRKAAAAVPAGFVLFVVAWVFLVVVAFGFPYSTKYSTVAVAAFSTLPWTLLSKGIQDLAAASQGRLDGLSWSQRYSYCLAAPPSPEQLASGELGYWQAGCVMPLGQAYWVLAAQCAGYLALALYLDVVLPDDGGARWPPWFLLQPSFWQPSRKRNLGPAAQALEAPAEWEDGLLVDPDVQQETDKMRGRARRYVGAGFDSSAGALSEAEGELVGGAAAARGAGGAAPAAVPAAGEGRRVIHLEARCVGPPTAPAPLAPAVAGSPPAGQHPSKEGLQGTASGAAQRQYAVEMYGMRKVFRRRGSLLRSRPFVAVRGNWLGIYEGECFCLLGPNGAGKSTTLSCLTGVTPLTAGDALVYGESIALAAGMDRVRPLIGVCTQFDVLWDQLTGREHLLLGAAIKGLPCQGWAAEAAQLLEEVRLTEAAGVRAGAYSGGMKRRLSVAIALLGDPKLVFLDEPSAGLDPLSRRHLWDLVDKAKQQRAIVLTTHSMEEADILGDRIGIMARGRLRCVGTSLRLKARFGSGYRVSVRVGVEGPALAMEHSPTLSSWASILPSSPLSESRLLQPTASPGRGGSEAPAGSAALERHSAPAHAAHAAEQQAQQPRSATSPCEIEPELEQEPSLDAGLGGGEGSGQGAGAAVQPGGQEEGRSPLVAVQMGRVRAVFLDRLGVKPADEGAEYLHFLVPYEHEDKLPMLFAYLKAHAQELGVVDVQLRLTPLEEVFLNVARKAELEAAQAEGRYEEVHLADEGVTIKVPIGADLIQSPGGHLYHMCWGQDPETGELQLQDYWRDPVSAAAPLEDGKSLAGSSEGSEVLQG